MVRAPCCEKMGLKKGPWTPEEDQTLIAYIRQHGHGNWRALPKHAGLLRCGKSCRLRWTNYLRPDIKRGNFSKEEEETIINLHGLLGNRWSAIAAKLPGRTDNEIKNVWHTHLKKRLKKTNNNISINEQEREDYPKKPQPSIEKTKGESIIKNGMGQDESERWDVEPITSPSSSAAPTPTHRFEHPSQQLLTIIDSPMRSSSSDFSTTTTTTTECSTVVISAESTHENVMKVDDEDDHYVVSLENFPQITEDNSLLWFQAITMESFITSTTVVSSEEFIRGATSMDQQEEEAFKFPVSSVSNTGTNDGSCVKEDNDFWRDLFREAGELTELPGF